MYLIKWQMHTLSYALYGYKYWSKICPPYLRLIHTRRSGLRLTRAAAAEVCGAEK